MMKKITTLIIAGALLVTAGTYAQSDDADVSPTGQGKFLLGGNSNFNSGVSKISSQDATDRTFSNFNVRPLAGYFVANNFVIGSGVRLSFAKTKFESAEEVAKDRVISFEPFARYYFDLATVKPYLEVTSGFGSGKGTGNFLTADDSGTFETKSNFFNIGATAGIAVFLNKNISIDFGLEYANSQAKRESDISADFVSNESFERVEQFSLRAGFSIFL